MRVVSMITTTVIMSLTLKVTTDFGNETFTEDHDGHHEDCRHSPCNFS